MCWLNPQEFHTWWVNHPHFGGAVAARGARMPGWQFLSRFRPHWITYDRSKDTVANPVLHPFRMNWRALKNTVLALDPDSSIPVDGWFWVLSHMMPCCTLVWNKALPKLKCQYGKCEKCSFDPLLTNEYLEETVPQSKSEFSFWFIFGAYR